MKMVLDGRLWDDDFMNDVAARTFDATDPVTGEIRTYREELKREYVLKEGHTLEDTWVSDGYGYRRIVKDNCNLAKGQFVLKRCSGYSGGTFTPVCEDVARAWFEKYCPDQVDLYREIFGEPENPWTKTGTVELVKQAESRLSSMKWEKERAEERANNADAELKALKAELKEVRNALAAANAAKQAARDKISGVSAEPEA